MKTAIAPVVAAMFFGFAVAGAQAPSGYEQEPVLDAKDLATPELLSGPHFTVDPKVPVKGFIERLPSGRSTAPSRPTGSASSRSDRPWWRVTGSCS